MHLMIKAKDFFIFKSLGVRRKVQGTKEQFLVNRNVNALYDNEVKTS